MNEQAGTAIGSGDGRLFVAPPPQELNKALPNFEVECLIGQGGMGAVYKARQPKLDRYVAIKVVPRSLGSTELNFVERFQREARAMAGLNHPNIVTVHDFGETESGYLYIVMEYVDGRDMHHAIVSGEAGVNVALNWMIQLCDAIQYAHEHDVVHRDIKPANILINRENHVKVGDFGLVKLIGRKRETAITISQLAMGTPDYSAPESLEEGGNIDHRADLYSMGVLLYELLTRKVPRGAWKPPSAFVPVNPRLDQIVIKAMQPDPNQRYQSAAQLKEALEAVRSMGASGETQAARMGVAESAETASAPRAGSKKYELTLKSARKKRERAARIAQLLIALLVIGVGVGAIGLLAARPELLQRFLASRTEPQSLPSASPAAPSASSAQLPADAPAGVVDAADALRLVGVEEGWVDVVPTLAFPRDLVSGRWKIHGKTLKPQIQKNTDRSRLRVPMLLEPSYEVALEVGYSGAVVPFALTLPLRAGPLPVLIGEAGLPDEPPFLVIGAGGDQRNGRPETTRRFPVKLTASGRHSFSVKVVNRDEQVGIVVLVDGAECGRFLGSLRDFAAGGKPEVQSRQVVFGAAGALEVSLFRVRSLPPGEWLPEPARPSGAKRTSKTVAAAPKQPAVKVPATAPADAVKAATEAVKQQVGAIAAEFEKREREFAHTTYNVEVASLREKYNAALNRTLLENNSIPVQAAVQREQMRIREGEPVEPTDPPEMPDIVKKARSIYRLELAKLDEQLNLALAPMLREHLESLNSLEAEKTAAGQCPAAAKAMLAEARKLVEQRLEKVRSFLDASAKARAAAESAGNAKAVPPALGAPPASPAP